MDLSFVEQSNILGLNNFYKLLSTFNKMKHNLKITIILLSMFLITQLIGLFVINHYSVQENELPYGLGSETPQEPSEYNLIFVSIVFAFVLAIGILFFLIRFDLSFILRLWFFVVVVLALGITFNYFFKNLQHAAILALVIALPLAFLKIYKQNYLVHNLTELLIYPGLAAVFVPILNFTTMIILLILISIYDAWAVWKSGIMQKMAKYQINNVKTFSGFFVPYLNKKQKEKLRKMRKSEKEKLRKKGIKVNVAILGGGDVAFTLIPAGVMLKTFGLTSAILVILGALVGLSSIFLISKKKKFYPAMPFITAGIFLGILVNYLL